MTVLSLNIKIIIVLRYTVIIKHFRAVDSLITRFAKIN